MFVFQQCGGSAVEEFTLCHVGSRRPGLAAALLDVLLHQH